MFHYTQTMDRILKEEVESGYVKGNSVLVLQKDKEIYYNHFGFADEERKMPMRRDTIIRLFSMTKPVTAAAVMLLMERGELDVHDPVSRYLPEFAGQKVWTDVRGSENVKRDSTIWDMLNMTSGIPYPDMATESGRRMDVLFRRLIARREQGERVDTREYLREIAKIPCCFQPGEKWMYGLSADVLAGVVEVISGCSYGTFLEKELFEPLDMVDTGFFVPEEKKGRFAQIYEWQEEKKQLVPSIGSHLGEYYEPDVAYESGGCGLVSTMDDYSHFAQMMLHKGEYKGKRILGRKTVEFMTQNRLNETQMENYNWESNIGYGYGCLMRVLIDPGAAGTNASVGEYGWDGWTGNYCIMDPAEQLAILYFTQRGGGGNPEVIRKIRAATYGALE